MKKLTLLASTLLITASAFGQSSKAIKADVYHREHNYKAAAKVYEKILRKDSTNAPAVTNLIDSYLRINEAEKADKWLLVFLNNSTDPDPLKQMALMLAKNGKYHDAVSVFEKAAATSSDQEIQRWLTAYSDLSRFYADSSLYEIKKATFNSISSDFSPVFFGDGVVFSSTRGSVNPGSKKTAFTDLYFSKDDDEKTVPFSKVLNSKYHEGPLTFNATQDTVYFTRSIYRNKSAIKRLHIYSAVLEKKKWTNVQKFPFNDDSYSIGHPAFAGSNVLYFASDMPGGYGGTDLYKSEKINGEWQKPVNLGPEINTSGNEMFPFVSEDGTLYFASTGHPGLGGLDIFYAARNGSSFSEVKNMGYPINTSGDDFGLVIKGSSGYFTSNSKSLQDDIYFFELKPLPDRQNSDAEATGKLE